MSFCFPPEIEDEVFRWAVHIHPYHSTAAILALVSKRVHIWVEPMLYETLMFRGGPKLETNMLYLMRGHEELIHEEGFAETVKSKPPSFFRKSVKNLLITHSVSKEFVLEILSICSGVQHLGVWYNYDDPTATFEHITKLPLQSLEFHSTWILNKLLERRPEFPSLTYISIDCTYTDADLPGEAYRLLPALLHVQIRYSYNTRLSSSSLETLVRNVKHLQTLTLILDWETPPPIWMLESNVSEKDWKSVDSRIQLVSSPLGRIEFWRERVKNGYYHVYSPRNESNGKVCFTTKVPDTYF
ncbi:hypothetical protein BDQ17DRAFT_1548499 [Cyathus striatus]|nr:hypothetical protein BDQ17DRAFT_1548499 [Cyathus striatus]